MSDDIQVRTAEQGDLEALGSLWRTAFHVPQHSVDTMPQRLRLPRLLVATRDGDVVASTQRFPMRQWFGGRPVSMSGIASVAVHPLQRGTGVGSRAMTETLRRARDEGFAMSSLYPATVPVYRRLGYELAGVQTVYRVAIDALPAGSGALVDVPDDGGPIKASYERLGMRENGLTEGIDDDWWPWRVLGRWSHEPKGAVMTPEEVPDGYAAYQEEDLSAEWGYKVACSHLVAHTKEAALALFGYFRRFKGVGRHLEWNGPPVESLALVLPEQSLSIVREFRNMSRILDVPDAFESRGYPAVSGSATFSVRDPLFEDNTGTFLLEAEEGKVQVSRQPSRGRAAKGAISIGALTTMYTGFVTPSTAAAVGLVDPDHPALRLFERLFAGPPPWTPDFF